MTAAALRALQLLLVGVAGAYVLVAAVAFFTQRSLLYFPSRYAPGAAAAEVRAAGARVVRLRAADGVALEAWWFPPRDETSPVILHCHGNGGDVRGRAPEAAAWAARGVGVLLLEYRGYGGSAGAPSEAGLALDAEAAWGFLSGEAGIAPGRIVLLGESLGGGIAAGLAAKRAPGALVLVSTFTSAVDRGAEAYPWLPVRLLMLDRFPIAALAPRIRCPVLVVHGRRDTLIGVHHGEANARAFAARAGATTETWWVDDADHNNLLSVAGRAYFDRIGGFAGRAASPPAR